MVAIAYSAVAAPVSDLKSTFMAQPCLKLAPAAPNSSKPVHKFGFLNFEQLSDTLY
jgi:hypothetical protein